MSNYNYNPIPPRVWSRVQNPCTFTIPGSDYTQAFIPLTGQTVSQAQADYETKQIYKGNILQYKGNSARLTKSQRYSQLARCAGPNRTKVFATQSETYTNPNTTGLLRVGFQTYPYPNDIVGAPNNISGPFQYNVENPNDCSGNSVQDGGTLVCGTFANPCTGEIIKQGNNSATICNPASASNVPGSSVLCWNNKVQTWFPKPRYVMNNSTDKWPQGYKGFVSANQLNSPFITSVTSNLDIVTLIWTFNDNCLFPTNFNIYQNNVLVLVVNGNIFSANITVANCNFYEYYIIAENMTAKTISEPSNIVTINIAFIEPPSNLAYNTIASGEIQLTWKPPCIQVLYYNIYNNTMTLIGNTNTLFFDINGLTNCSSYEYYVTAVDTNLNESTPVVINNVVPLWPNPPINLSGTWDLLNTVTISWDTPFPNCSPPTSYNLYYSTDNVTFTPINNIPANSSSYNFTPVIPPMYYFYMTSVNALGESNPTSTISVMTSLFIVTTISGETPSISSTTSGATTTYNIIINPGENTLIFSKLPDTGYANFQLVGGGGGGGGSWGDTFNAKLYSGAGGGGGGNLLVNNYIVSISDTYTITVGSGGSSGNPNDGFGSSTQTSGGKGGDTSITSTGLNLIAYGGDGGGCGTSSSKSTGGGGGSFFSTIGGSGGSGGTGGNGNGGSSGQWDTGTPGTNGYFYDNQSLTYSPSNSFPTYSRPPVPNYPSATNPNSITLTNWYTVSGGGGAANSIASNQFVSGNGGSGTGTGGLDGSNWNIDTPITNPPPYASFGGGGGGGGAIPPGFPGGNGLAVIWFSYTSP